MIIRIMPAVIKSVKSFGLYASLFLAVAYLILYGSLSETSRKTRVYLESASILNTTVPVRFAMNLNATAPKYHASQNSSQSEPKAVPKPSSGVQSTLPNPRPSKSSNKKKEKKKEKKKRPPFNLSKEIKLKSDSKVQKDLKVEYNLNDLTQAPNCSYWNDTAMPPYARFCEQKNVVSKPLITLFTTMHYSTKDLNILNNTIRLWAQLGPRVRRVLFVSSPQVERHLVKMACDADWDVMTAPLCDRNKLPVLKSMFMAAQQIHQSDFYGYANGDILFDESLLKTLDFIKKDYLKYFNKTLFVGSRTNIKLQPNQTITDLKQLKILSQNGTDGWVAAVDFFLSSRDGYDWPDIPKAVIGRIAYDNWMIWHARRKKFAVFDITNSSLSVHQLGTGKYYGSHHKRDGGINGRVLGGFDFTKGLISCAQLKTKIENNMIKLKKRMKYGMCGSGHWGKRRISRYGDEIEADFEVGMTL